MPAFCVLVTPPLFSRPGQGSVRDARSAPARVAARAWWCSHACPAQAECRHLVFVFMPGNIRPSALADTCWTCRSLRAPSLRPGSNRHLADEIKSWKVTKFFAKPTADRGRLALPRGHWSVERVRCPASASMVSTRRSLSLGMHLPSLWTNRHDHFP
ncbi:hypothetical protein XFF6992_650046 [Xanthomonas citri pv. fuscans]|nr:hypothetical protein XFF6992_650046 [Xanthomonas citri pv. fuscans]SOO35721.1 hypothetical protein XFF6994_5650020 [Xanthomonas citri pv. fuscans]